MGRPLRAAAGNLVYHVLNRANGRLKIFEKATDYKAFERAMAEARERFDMRILAYCLMPNHWYLVLWPQEDNDLSRMIFDSAQASDLQRCWVSACEFIGGRICPANQQPNAEKSLPQPVQGEGRLQSG